jgi:hypothetical protein
MSYSSRLHLPKTHSSRVTDALSALDDYSQKMNKTLITQAEKDRANQNAANWGHHLALGEWAGGRLFRSAHATRVRALTRALLLKYLLVSNGQADTNLLNQAKQWCSSRNDHSEEYIVSQIEWLHYNHNKNTYQAFERAGEIAEIAGTRHWTASVPTKFFMNDAELNQNAKARSTCFSAVYHFLFLGGVRSHTGDSIAPFDLDNQAFINIIKENEPNTINLYHNRNVVLDPGTPIALYYKDDTGEIRIERLHCVIVAKDQDYVVGVNNGVEYNPYTSAYREWLDRIDPNPNAIEDYKKSEKRWKTMVWPKVLLYGISRNASRFPISFLFELWPQNISYTHIIPLLSHGNKRPGQGWKC